MQNLNYIIIIQKMEKISGVVTQNVKDGYVSYWVFLTFAENKNKLHVCFNVM